MIQLHLALNADDRGCQLFPAIFKKPVAIHHGRDRQYKKYLIAHISKEDMIMLKLTFTNDELQILVVI